MTMEFPLSFFLEEARRRIFRNVEKIQEIGRYAGINSIFTLW